MANIYVTCDTVLSAANILHWSTACSRYLFQVRYGYLYKEHPPLFTMDICVPSPESRVSRQTVLRWLGLVFRQP